MATISSNLIPILVECSADAFGPMSYSLLPSAVIYLKEPSIAGQLEFKVSGVTSAI